MTIVLLHGAAGSRRTYDWLPDLGQEVIRPDLRGHGAAPRGSSYRLDDYVQDVLAMLHEPVVLAGHSLGGVIAWTIAQRAPELVRALFMEDPPLYMGRPELHATNAAIPRFVAFRDGAWANETEAIAWLDAQPHAGGTIARDATEARAYAILHVDRAALDAVIDGSTLAGTDTTSPVPVPALILAAGVYPAFPPEHEEWLAATHPDVEVRRVAGAAHSIHDELEHRAEYLSALAAL